MSVRVVTPPTAVILTPSVVREQLRLGTDPSDTVLVALIVAATAAIDGPAGWLGRCVGVQTLELTLDGFCGFYVPLPYPPLIEVVSVKYDDVLGVEQIFPSASYGFIRDRGLYIKTGAWPATVTVPGSVRVQYRAGYADVPAPIKQAIILGVRELLTTGAQDPSIRSETVDGVSTQTWTISADTMTPLRQTAERLLGPYRVFA